MDFLELCKRVRQKSGLSGDIAAVTGQQGILAKLVTWVQDADLEIQRSHADWSFMWRKVTSALVVGKNEYLPADFGMSPFASVSKLYLGATEINPVPWSQLEHSLLSNGSVPTGQPGEYALSPDGMIVFNRNPTSADAVHIRYYLASTPMTLNTSVSLIPAEFHEAIVQRALQSYASSEQDDQLQRDAMAQFESISKEMAARFLPKITFATRGFY